MGLISPILCFNGQRSISLGQKWVCCPPVFLCLLGAAPRLVCLGRLVSGISACLREADGIHLAFVPSCPALTIAIRF